MPNPYQSPEEQNTFRRSPIGWRWRLLRVSVVMVIVTVAIGIIAVAAMYWLRGH